MPQTRHKRKKYQRRREHQRQAARRRAADRVVLAGEAGQVVPVGHGVRADRAGRPVLAGPAGPAGPSRPSGPAGSVGPTRLRRVSRGRAVVAVVATAALCVGTWLIVRGAESGGPPPQPSKAQAFPRTDGGRGASSFPPLPPSTPIRVRVPEIRVDAPVKPLGLLPDGSLDSPPDDNRNLTGWYAAGTQPGAAGTAIVAGHVDTAAGPAVFYGLGALKKGNTIEVRRADGRTAVFTTDAIEVYDRKEFPSKKVYGASSRAELRLITCGGGFSEETGSYLGNVVVFAHLTGVKT
ncbi:class F sortase [Streptomyces netropsis]|uniref:Class F sortase n=1 Tax=Streptomyces netropsis TaxID=55404 RepID=A0A7W7LBG3_STRNE|nr:hypothetical protein [Streptomyces netropsis]GGR24388.1 hypothetical protein GCM10010219_31450 [Streptomyces netropsis]